jgi:hypothetical protein
VDLDVRAVALHRPAAAAVVRALAGVARRVPVVAVWGDHPGADVGAPVLVVDGGSASPEDRERSLEALCRRLHAVPRPLRVALRTPPSPDHHPSPAEVALVCEAVKRAGYWHEPDRGGAAFLEAAARYLQGASGHPLHLADLAGLRDALPRRAPFVVVCPAGTPRAVLVEALSCAAGVFG